MRCGICDSECDGNLKATDDKSGEEIIVCINCFDDYMSENWDNLSRRTDDNLGEELR